MKGLWAHAIMNNLAGYSNARALVKSDHLRACRSILIDIAVGEGETLESMAAKLGMPYERLLAANHGLPPPCSLPPCLVAAVL